MDNNVLIRSGGVRLVGWSRQMLYSGFNILPRSVVRRQTGFAARITRTVCRLPFPQFTGQSVKKRKFSIGTLFVAVTALALLIPAVVYPGGYLLYLPVFAIFLTSVALYRSLFKHQRSERRCVILSVLLALFVFAFVSLFDVAVSRYQETAYFTNQFKRVTSLEDPMQFRSKALELHQLLLDRDPEDRVLSGDSDIVPLEIRRMRPTTIVASDDCLVINMALAGTAQIVIYPADSKIGRVSSFKVANDFYYWGRQK